MCCEVCVLPTMVASLFSVRASRPNCCASLTNLEHVWSWFDQYESFLWRCSGMVWIHHPTLDLPWVHGIGSCYLIIWFQHIMPIGLAPALCTGLPFEMFGATLVCFRTGIGVLNARFWCA